MAHLVKNILYCGIFAVLWVRCTPKAVREMQADMADNKLDEKYRLSVDVCPHPPRFAVKLHKKKLRDAIPQFLMALEGQLLPVIDKEIQNLNEKKIYVNARKYGKCSLKDLNPKASKKQNKKLGIPSDKQARHLYETAWWLTSMLTTATELKEMRQLSTETRLTTRLDQMARHALLTLQEMDVKVPERSSICTRNTTIEFPLDGVVSFSDKADYAAVSLLDMRHGVNQIIKKLGRCKISVKKSKNGKSTKNRKSRKGRSRRKSKIAKIRCKKVKSVFYKKREARSRRPCK